VSRKKRIRGLKGGNSESLVAEDSKKSIKNCRIQDGDHPLNMNHIAELEPKLVQEWFGTGRYGRMGTIGDGSCFFHSICQSTNFRNYSYTFDKAERQTIVDDLRLQISNALTTDLYTYIQSQMQDPSDVETFDTIKSNLIKRSVWANEFMIRLTSILLNKNIIFMNVSRNTNQPYCNVHLKSSVEDVEDCKEPKEATIIVAWVDKSHFELVVRIDSVNHVTRQFFPGDSHNPKQLQDIDTVVGLLKSYVMRCRLN